MDNPIECLKKLSREDNMTYEEVVSNWRTANISKDIFHSHLLTQLTSESSSIEGIDVSYNRTKELLTSGSVVNYTGDVRDLYSILNSKNVAEFLNYNLLNDVPITSSFIKECHAIVMFGSLDNKSYNINGERAGQYKKHDYCVGKHNSGVGPAYIEEYIDDLCSTISVVDETKTLKMASAFHCYFEAIHPFADGNGRVGRWLLNYFLVLNNHPPIVISSLDKQEYYLCLEKFDEYEELDSMFEFLKKQTISSYKSYSYLI